MELAFETKELRDICEHEARAKQELGKQVAEKLKHRLADMISARTVTDLVAGELHEVDGAHPRNMAVKISEGVRLVFSANHNEMPLSRPGAVDWSKVRRIKLVRIEDNDG